MWVDPISTAFRETRHWRVVSPMICVLARTELKTVLQIHYNAHSYPSSLLYKHSQRTDHEWKTRSTDSIGTRHSGHSPYDSWIVCAQSIQQQTCTDPECRTAALIGASIQTMHVLSSSVDASTIELAVTEERTGLLCFMSRTPPFLLHLLCFVFLTCDEVSWSSVLSIRS